MLVVLCLPDTPAADILPTTRRAWFDTLAHHRTWHRGSDAPLIRETFDRLRMDPRWPTLARFREVLGAVTPLPTYLALGAPVDSRTPEERREHLLRISEDTRKLLGLP